MKKIVIALITVMFFFNNDSALSNYEKVFFDFEIKSVNGKIIQFNKLEKLDKIENDKWR